MLQATDVCPPFTVMPLAQFIDWSTAEVRESRTAMLADWMPLLGPAWMTTCPHARETTARAQADATRGGAGSSSQHSRGLGLGGHPTAPFHHQAPRETCAWASPRATPPVFAASCQLCMCSCNLGCSLPADPPMPFHAHLPPLLPATASGCYAGLPSMPCPEARRRVQPRQAVWTRPCQQLQQGADRAWDNAQARFFVECK